ncbi:MAG: glycosyltransferase family 4 protein [Ignavibacteria bacterium]|nr:glycosyltransferase family 4 protein [Ignavibacteria bacterium]
MNILHLTPDFNYSDGRSYYVYLILKYLKKAGHNVFLCTNDGDSFDRLEDQGIPVFINESLSRKSSFLKSAKYISDIAETHNIDILHSHHRYYELLANSLIKKNKIRTVFTALSIVDKRFFVEYKSDRIIAVSNCVRDVLIKKFNVNENKIFLIPNFVDSEEVVNRESSIGNRQSEIGNRKSEIGNRETDVVNRQSSIVNRELSRANNKINILSVGRFHRDKDFETLFKAIALLKDYKIKLTLIGEGEEKDRYENIIKLNDLNAELIPPQRDLNQFFNNADLCVLTSIRDPLPGFMLQSGLHKKPFIGSDVDGISEVIINEKNGLTFEMRNEIQLSEKIVMFVNNADLAKRCAKNLNELVTRKYTEKTVMPEIEKLYISLLS